MRTVSIFFLILFTLALPARPLQAAQQARQNTRQARPAAASPAPSSITPEAAEQYVLNMTGVYPVEHPLVREVLRPWADSLLERSGGRLVIRFFEPYAIAASNSLGRAVRLGQVGLGLGFISADPGDFYLSILAAQGPGSTSLRALSAAYWRMYTEIPELSGEFRGIKLLAACAADPAQFCMVGQPPYGLDALKKLRFLVESPLEAEKLESLGAVASIIPQSDFKMFVEDMAADGLVLSLSDVARLGLADHVGGVALGDLENEVIWLGMHQGVWDMLPQDIRDILAGSAGTELSQKLGAALEGIYRSELEKLGRGGTARLHYLSAEERSKFYLNMRDIVQAAWRNAARERGCDAVALQGKIDRIMAETKAR